MKHDPALLTKTLDKAKTGVFLGKNAAFFAPLMCSLGFEWDETMETAGTDYEKIYFGPDYFMGLPPDSRKTELMHELHHPARLHGVRKGSREHELWNIACDIRIDLSLLNDGYTFEGIPGVLSWKHLDAKKYAQNRLDALGKRQVWTEEDIYEDLIKKNFKPPPNYKPDMKDKKQSPGDQAKQINAVVKAIQQAKIAGAPGSIPGDIELIISKFLTPVVPWEQHLFLWMSDLLDEEYTWSKPNRRIHTAYVPSKFIDDGRLEHLRLYHDVSGSITDADLLRFNSEVKYMKERFNPKLLTLVQFDTKIQKTTTYTDNDTFDVVKVVGRGGTHLECVRQDIIQHNPTGVIIFSDLDCAPMGSLPFDIPVLWVCVHGFGKQVPFGKLIHVR